MCKYFNRLVASPKYKRLEKLPWHQPPKYPSEAFVKFLEQYSNVWKRK